MSHEAEVLPQDTFNILLATDLHLGYAENDSARGEDSFNTFEEILCIAEKKGVDFILLGGDLFHDNKPSPRCIYRCMSLIRRYCMGDRPIAIEFVSDQAENFQHCFSPHVNYEDPNLNISIPVFSIHGNHDDPSGYGRICSLDILSVSGLVNYFGKWDDLQHVKVSPLLMKKGATSLALYGLSHITDDRLSRLFQGNKVEFFRPEEDTESWFNMFVLHQNRVNRGFNKYIQDTMLPEFLDLVMWGHEHECLIEPEWSFNQEFRIIQPGSPVATSLCEAEAVEKFIGILKIHKKRFQLHPIKLKTVRPFVIDTISLSRWNIDMSKPNPSEEVQSYLSEYVENMITKAGNQISGHPRQPVLPLVRLRVEYQHEQQAFNVIRFGEKFQKKVSNPSSLIALKREKKEMSNKDEVDAEVMGNVLLHEHTENVMWGSRVEDVVEKYFSTVDPDGKLQVLSVKGMAQAVMRFVDKDDKDAVEDLINYQMKRTLEHLEKIHVQEDDVEKEIDNFRIQRSAKGDAEVKDALSVLESQARLKNQSLKPNPSHQELEEDDPDCEVAERTVSRGKGKGSRGRGKKDEVNTNENRKETNKGTRGGRGRAKRAMEPVVQQSTRRSSRAHTSKMFLDSDEDDSL